MRLISALRARISARNLMIIHYEKLVYNPEFLVRRICEFIGENVEEDMLNVISYNSSSQTTSKGIFTTSVGRWRNTPDNEGAFVGQMIASSELDEYGYQIEKLRVSTLRMAKILISTPWAFLRAVHANKEMRGPVIPYLAKRILPFLHWK